MRTFRGNPILSSRRLAEVVVVLALFVLDTVSMAGLIQLTDPSTNPEWRAIMFGQNQNDYLKDLQTGQPGGDIVGLGNQPGAMWAFDGTNMAFRVRLDATPSKNVMIGVDGDQNGSLDFYYVFDNSKPIETFDAGTGANVSPSTSDLGKNPMQQITRVDGTNFAIATVTSIDSGFKHDF